MNGVGSIQRLAPEALNSQTLSFSYHLGGRNARYPDLHHTHAFIAMNLPFPPIEKLRAQIAAERNIALTGYGEAHITIINPPDLERDFSPLDVEAMSDWCAQNHLQRLEFFVRGVGRAAREASAGLDRRESYFLVVESEALHTFRRQLYDRFSLKEVLPKVPFQPHITIGFVNGDLYFENGVNKDETSLLQDWGKVPQNAQKAASNAL